MRMLLAFLILTALFWFGIAAVWFSQTTASQRMAAAGYTRRPKGWTKEDEE